MDNAKTFQEWAKEILHIIQAAANGEVIQGRFEGDCSDWEDSEYDWEVLLKSCEYRVKPKTIRIGEYDVPEPIMEVHRTPKGYFIPVLNPSLVKWRVWHGTPADNEYLRLGLVHFSKENAELHAKAMLSAIKAGA